MAVFENNNKRYIIKGSWWWPQSSLRPIDKWMNVSKSTWLSEIRKSFSSFQVMPSDFFRNFYYPDTLVIPVKNTVMVDRPYWPPSRCARLHFLSFLDIPFNHSVSNTLLRDVPCLLITYYLRMLQDLATVESINCF